MLKTEDSHADSLRLGEVSMVCFICLSIKSILCLGYLRQPSLLLFLLASLVLREVSVFQILFKTLLLKSSPPIGRDESALS
jgi:hypothetical protein